MNLEQHLLMSGVFDDGMSRSTRENRWMRTINSHRFVKPIRHKQKEEERIANHRTGALRNLRRY